MKLKILIGLLAVCINANAAVVTLQSDFNKAVTNFAGVVIPNATGFVATGFFSTLSDAQLSTTGAIALGNDFQQFGPSGQFGFSGFGGVYQVEADGGRIAPATTFAGASIYTVLGNGTSVSTSTEFVIFKHTSTFQVDDQDAQPKTFTATLGESGTYLVGGPTGQTVNVGGANLAQIRMSPVPEPSSLILSVIGVLALLRRKR